MEMEGLTEPLFYSFCKCKSSELDIIRRSLGSKQIEKNEILFKEAKALLEILNDLRTDNEGLTLSVTSRTTPLPEATSKVLAQNQILQLIEFLRELLLKNTITGKKINGDQAMEEYMSKMFENNPEEKNIYKYVRSVNTSKVNEDVESYDKMRPSSSYGYPNKAHSATNSRPGTASSYRTNSGRPHSSKSRASQPSPLISSKASFILDTSTFDITQIEDQAAPLRSALIEEELNYMEEIEYIKLCIEEEVEIRQNSIAEASIMPPSMKELKVFRTKVERLISDAQDTTSISQKSPLERRSLPPLDKGNTKAPLSLSRPTPHILSNTTRKDVKEEKEIYDDDDDDGRESLDHSESKINSEYKRKNAFSDSDDSSELEIEKGGKKRKSSITSKMRGMIDESRFFS